LGSYFTEFLFWVAPLVLSEESRYVSKMHLYVLDFYFQDSVSSMSV